MLRKGWQVIRENRALYWWCNGVYYGLIILFMLLIMTIPQMQEALLGEITGEMETEGTLLSYVTETYTSGTVAKAAVITFVINLFAGTLLVLTLPSIIFPPWGVLMGAYRAVLWGILFSPAMVEMRQPMLLHWVTLLLEGQGYILAIFAGLVAFKGWLKPSLYEREGRLAGYWQGWKKAMPVFLLVVLVLAVAAVYEAATVIYMMQ